MFKKLLRILDQIGALNTIGLSFRHALTAFGGALAAKGLIDGTAVEPLVGALMVIAGVIMSAIQKYDANSV